MTWVRYQESLKKNESAAVASTQTPATPVSATTPAPKVDKLMIKLGLPLLPNNVEKTVVCTGYHKWLPIITNKGKETAREWTEQLFVKFYQKTLNDKKSSDFVIKVNGLSELLEGDIPLIDFDYIRFCVNQNKKIELSLIEKEVDDLYVEDFPAPEVIGSSCFFKSSLCKILSFGMIMRRLSKI
jgi:hypothetical protein